MKKILIAVSFIMSAFFWINAQDGYEFTTVKELKITPVNSQNRTGTC